MIGKEISHYRIIDQLGSGGMGVVYKAEDTKLKRTVALKFLPPELTRNAEAKARFEREAQAAAALNHPNIITIHEIGEFENQTYIAMEHVEGKTLKDKIKESRLKIKETVDYAVQIGQGLARAHEEGIVHRDIKPANIIITDRGEVKILDFGLAKLAGQAQLTKDASTLGTVAYMSPEQVGAKEVDQRTDIWSLGVVLYEMLTGEPPFKGDYEQSVIYAILNEEVKLSSASPTDISDALAKIVFNCLQKNPADRYQSIEEFSENLANYQKGNKPDKSIRRGILNKKTNTLFAVIAAMILIVFILISIQSEEKKVFDSIAVLPLKNLSGNPDKEWFSDGMTEALITELYNLKSIKVISRTSIMQFKDTDKTLPKIAEELNVSALVEGSALIIGDQVKITAKLIDAEQDQNIWVGEYIHDMVDILVLHKEVASTIALQVKSTLLPEEKLAFSGAKRVNPKAYEAYLQGKFYLYKLTKSDAEKAIQFFHSALKHQNDFALAYTGLAEAYNIMSTFGWISGKSGWLKSKKMALKALDIDNGLAEAHTMLADVKYIYELDWELAEIEFKKAIEINPNYSTAHSWYAVFLSASGRHEEAIAEIRIAQELDPLFFRVKVTSASVYIYARQYENAEDQLLQLVTLNDNLPLTHEILGRLYLITGRYEDAIVEIEKAMDLANDSILVPNLAQAYALKGDKIDARQLLDYWLNSKQENIKPAKIALTYLAFGEKEKAFEWLQNAYDQSDHYLFRLKVDPRFDPIRNDKRYIDLLNKIGLNP